MSLLLLFAVAAVGISFACSVCEAVLLSISPSYVGALQEKELPLGNRLRRLRDDLDRSLASILTVNTVANTAGAVGVGAQAQIVFDNQYMGVTSAVLTMLILFFGEIIPKTLGATFWRQLAPVMARIVTVFLFISYPIVVVATSLMGILQPKENQPQMSRDELKAMTELGYQEGVVEQGESRLLRNVLRFGDLRINDIMTPRTVLFAADDTTTVREFFDEYPNPIFSRIPVYQEQPDNMTGYVLKADLLLEMARDRFSTQLKEHVREVVFVPEYQSVRELFEVLVTQQHHIAMVVDEYGGIAGVVTMEDVVETLLGLEIVDESDVEQDMRALARKQWLRRAKRMGIAPEDFDPPAGLGLEDSTGQDREDSSKKRDDKGSSLESKLE